MRKARDKDQRDMDLIINLERQVAVMRASQETLSKDYKDLQARKATMLKDLKGTREQRVKAIEDSKLTFASLVKKIATESPVPQQDWHRYGKNEISDGKRERTSCGISRI